jgi:hypothetical protein
MPVFSSSVRTKLETSTPTCETRRARMTRLETSTPTCETRRPRMTRLVARLLIISQGQASLEINQTPPAYRKNTHNYGCYYRENIDYSSMIPARGFLH